MPQSLDDTTDWFANLGSDAFLAADKEPAPAAATTNGSGPGTGAAPPLLDLSGLFDSGPTTAAGAFSGDATGTSGSKSRDAGGAGVGLGITDMSEPPLSPVRVYETGPYVPHKRRRFPLSKVGFSHV